MLRRGPRAPCWNDSKMRSRSRGATPIPVSVTVTVTLGVRRTSARTSDRAALGSELHRVGQQVEHHLLEPQLVGVHESDLGRNLESEADRLAAPPVPASATARTRAPRRTGNVDRSRSIRPASTLDRSRMSLSRSSRCLPELQMSRRYSSWRSLSSPNMRSRSTSEKPMTALRGCEARATCSPGTPTCAGWRTSSSAVLRSSSPE